VGNWRRRAELRHLPFKLPYSELEHLVLSGQHLCFSLIEGTLISIAGWAPQQELVALIMAAER